MGEGQEPTEVQKQCKDILADKKFEGAFKGFQEAKNKAEAERLQAEKAAEAARKKAEWEGKSITEKASHYYSEGNQKINDVTGMEIPHGVAIAGGVGALGVVGAGLAAKKTLCTSSKKDDKKADAGAKGVRRDVKTGK